MTDACMTEKWADEEIEFVKNKDLTFKISVGYDGHRFIQPDRLIYHRKYFPEEKEVISNDEGGVDRQHREGGQDLESGSRKSYQCIYKQCDEGAEKRR